MLVMRTADVPIPVAPVEVKDVPFRINRRTVRADRTAAPARTPLQARASFSFAPKDSVRDVLDSSNRCSVERFAFGVWQLVDRLRTIPTMVSRRFISKNPRRVGEPSAQGRKDRLRLCGGRRLDDSCSQERGRGSKKKGISPEQSLEKQALGRSRGGFSTKIHVLCEGAGLPICVVVTPGQTHEATMLEPLLDGVKIGGKPGPPRTRFDVVAGDKGYDGEDQRQAIRDRGAEPLIPHRKKKDGMYPERAAGFDNKQYKRRNVVERLIGRLKEFRRIATRYDKLAESFRAFVIVGFIRIWTQYLLLDTP